MNKKILTVKHTFEDNFYKESVAHIPFDAILYYYYDIYADDGSKDYYIVLVGCLKELSISEDEYNQVVNYFEEKYNTK